VDVLPDALYIVRFGVVDLYAGRKSLKSIGRGEMFGENALLVTMCMFVCVCVFVCVCDCVCDNVHVCLCLCFCLRL